MASRRGAAAIGTRLVVLKVGVATVLEDAVLPEPWVSVEDVARHLGVSKDTIYRWAEARKMPAHRVGRFCKFKLAEID